MTQNITGYTIEDIQRFKNMCEDNTNWKLVYKKGDNEIYSQKGDGATAKFKCISYQSKEYEPEHIFSAYCDRDYCKTQKSNDVLFEVIKQIDCCNEIIHRAQKMPAISLRDFVYKFIRYHNKENTEFIIFSESIDYDVPLMKDATRGHINTQGTYIKKTENSKDYIIMNTNKLCNDIMKYSLAIYKNM